MSTIDVLIVFDTDAIIRWIKALKRNDIIQDDDGTDQNGTDRKGPIPIKDHMHSLLKTKYIASQDGDIRDEIMPLSPIQMVTDPKCAEYDNGSDKLYIIAQIGDEIRWRATNLNVGSLEATFCGIKEKGGDFHPVNGNGVCIWRLDTAATRIYYYVFSIGLGGGLRYYQGDPMIDVIDSTTGIVFTVTVGGPKLGQLLSRLGPHETAPSAAPDAQA